MPLQVWLRRSPNVTPRLRARTACSCRRAGRAVPLTVVPGVPAAGAPCAAAVEALARAVRPARCASGAAGAGGKGMGALAGMAEAQPTRDAQTARPHHVQLLPRGLSRATDGRVGRACRRRAWCCASRSSCACPAPRALRQRCCTALASKALVLLGSSHRMLAAREGRTP